jgi:hypothetical protein
LYLSAKQHKQHKSTAADLVVCYLFGLDRDRSRSRDGIRFLCGSGDSSGQPFRGARSMNQLDSQKLEALSAKIDSLLEIFEKILESNNVDIVLTRSHEKKESS